MGEDEKAYDALVLGEGIKNSDPYQAVQESYADGINDEFVLPVVLTDGTGPVTRIGNGDTVVFFNFRADRARQITRALALDEFEGFERPAKHPRDLFYICLTEYDEEFPLPIAFPPIDIKNGLGRF